VRTKLLVGAVVTVVVGAAVVVSAILILHATAINQPLVTAEVRGTANTSQGVLPHAFLDLSTWPDSMAGYHGSTGGAHPGWVTYGPSTNLQVPAHSLVTVTIHQYDSGEALLNPFFAKVRGTVGGRATLNGKSYSQIDYQHTAHTFTARGIPSATQPSLFINVPLPPVSDDAPAVVKVNGTMYPKPNVIVFSFVTGDPGRYAFNCEFPCGISYQGFGGPMSTLGYMAGTLTVAG
jgi:hypothetical protein